MSSSQHDYEIRRLWDSRTEARMWAARLVIMGNPFLQPPAEVFLAEWNHEVQTFRAYRPLMGVTVGKWRHHEILPVQNLLAGQLPRSPPPFVKRS